jgi:hypothetical protein
VGRFFQHFFTVGDLSFAIGGVSLFSLLFSLGFMFRNILLALSRGGGWGGSSINWRLNLSEIMSMV